MIPTYDVNVAGSSFFTLSGRLYDKLAGIAARACFQTVEVLMSGNKTGILYENIYALVRQIPPGHVCSYGQIGQVVGCTARTVGFALSALPAGNDVPWQRIVNSKGEVSSRADGDSHLLQRDLLEVEGVSFDDKNRIDLSRHGWIFSSGNQDRDGVRRS